MTILPFIHWKDQYWFMITWLVCICMYCCIICMFHSYHGEKQTNKESIYENQSIRLHCIALNTMRVQINTMDGNMYVHSWQPPDVMTLINVGRMMGMRLDLIIPSNEPFDRTSCHHEGFDEPPYPHGLIAATLSDISRVLKKKSSDGNNKLCSTITCIFLSTF